MPNRAAILKQQFMQSLGLPWQELLPEAGLEEILQEEAILYRNCVYTPIVTLWAMVSQVCDPDKSLSNAVKRIISWLAAAGSECPSNDTGAYSKARQSRERSPPASPLPPIAKWQFSSLSTKTPSHRVAPAPVRTIAASLLTEPGQCREMLFGDAVGDGAKKVPQVAPALLEAIAFVQSTPRLHQFRMGTQ